MPLVSPYRCSWLVALSYRSPDVPPVQSRQPPYHTKDTSLLSEREREIIENKMIESITCSFMSNIDTTSLQNELVQVSQRTRPSLLAYSPVTCCLESKCRYIQQKIFDNDTDMSTNQFLPPRHKEGCYWTCCTAIYSHSNPHTTPYHLCIYGHCLL